MWVEKWRLGDLGDSQDSCKHRQPRHATDWNQFNQWVQLICLGLWCDGGGWEGGGRSTVLILCSSSAPVSSITVKLTDPYPNQVSPSKAVLIHKGSFFHYVLNIRISLHFNNTIENALPQLINGIVQALLFPIPPHPCIWVIKWFTVFGMIEVVRAVRLCHSQWCSGKKSKSVHFSAKGG